MVKPALDETAASDCPAADCPAADCPAADGTECATAPVPSAALGGPISHAIFRVARLHRLLAGHLLRRVGLHPGQEMLMMYLWETGPQRQADLVAVLGSDSATMTRTVQRLERADFVRRRRCAEDRRVVIVEPTAASQALRGQVEQIWSQLERLTTAGMRGDERVAAQHVLESLEHNLTGSHADRAC